MLRFAPLLAALSMPALFAATPSIGDLGVPVTTVVTLRAKTGETPAALTRDDVLVSQDNRRALVSSVEPVRSLQLWVLIDDGADKDLALQFAALSNFIRQQPPSTEIGIGYMSHGAVRQLQPLTADHERAAAALRIPMGPPGVSASPYMALSDLVKHWANSGPAREVLMISSGIDPFYGPGPENPYLMQAIEDAQRGNVLVHAIFYRTTGDSGSGGTYWGQNNLAQVTDETAGEFYWEGSRNPVSIAPYLDELNRRLNAQYVVTFQANAGSKPALRNIKVTTDVSHVKLAAPVRVLVPAT
jgi:hypothetical protein